jgi:hypothetical protein
MLTHSAVPDAYCQGVTFQVTNNQQLARAVALVLIQQFSLARRLVASFALQAEPVGIAQSDVDDIIRRRLHPADTDHRDGLLFQLIMWLASHLDPQDGDLVSLPHSQGSAKGQDLIVVHRTAGAVTAITICEDKATVNPRATIRAKVWPEIKEYEAGGRRDELRSAVISILGTGGVGADDAEQLVKRISWEGKRRYRVRVTIEGPRLADLFKGFDTVVVGTPELRRGDTVLVPDMRAWMTRLALAVESELRTFATST